MNNTPWHTQPENVPFHPIFHMVPVMNSSRSQRQEVDHIPTRQFEPINYLQMDYLGNVLPQFPAPFLNAHHGELAASGVYHTHQQSPQKWFNERNGYASEYSLMDLINGEMGFESGRYTPEGVGFNDEDLLQTSDWVEELKSGRSTPGGESFTSEEEIQTLPLPLPSLENFQPEESYINGDSYDCDIDPNCIESLGFKSPVKRQGTSKELSLENMFKLSSINEHDRTKNSEVHNDPPTDLYEIHFPDIKNKIFIKGLSLHLNEEHIHRCLSSFGAIQFDNRTKKPLVWIWTDKRTGLLSGLVSVHYVNAESAMKAFNELNGKVLDGVTTLRVEFERNKLCNLKENTNFNKFKSVQNSRKNGTVKHHSVLNDLSGSRDEIDSNDREGKTDSSRHTNNVKSVGKVRHNLGKSIKTGTLSEENENELISSQVKTIPNGFDKNKSSGGVESGNKSHNNYSGTLFDIGVFDFNKIKNELSTHKDEIVSNGSDKKKSSSDAMNGSKCHKSSGKKGKVSANGEDNSSCQDKKNSGRPWLYRPNRRTK